MNNPPQESPTTHETKTPSALSRDEKWRRIKIVWAGYAASNFVGLLTMVIVPRVLEFFSAMSSTGPSRFVSALGVSTFIALPMVMGAVCAWIWKPLRVDGWKAFGYIFWNTFIALSGSAIVLREGAICLVMAAPLLLGFVWIGFVVGERLWDRMHKPLFVSFLPLCVLCLFWDVNGQNVTNSVSTSVTISATPVQVWHAMNHFSPIYDAPDYWLFKLGAPMPIVSRLSFEGVGARRDCILTGNLVFEEKVTVWKPSQQLTFDVTKQPHHPELTGHFRLLRGQMRLRDNGNGTTTLIGTSWYRLNVRPLWYWQWWSDDVIRHVHLRVMNRIKDEAQLKNSSAISY